MCGLRGGVPPVPRHDGPTAAPCCAVLCCAGEDLKKIHAGTWVGWKRYGESAAAGGPLFVAEAFYNFLCPQRPTAV